MKEKLSAPRELNSSVLSARNPLQITSPQEYTLFLLILCPFCLKSIGKAARMLQSTLHAGWQPLYPAGKRAPSTLLYHRTLERIVISGGTIIFLHDIALHYQSLLAWACKSLAIYLTNWAECDIACRESAAQPELPNSCLRRSHQPHP